MKAAQVFTFAPYGEMITLHNIVAQSIAVTGRLSSLGYSGEHFDAKAQQQYLRARFYNPTNGRFNRLDPYAGNMQDPQSLHKYAYVHGDPIQGVDPSGEIALGTVAIGIAIAFVAYKFVLPIFEANEDYLGRDTAVGLGGLNVTQEMLDLNAAIKTKWDQLHVDKKQDLVNSMSHFLDRDSYYLYPNFGGSDSWDVAKLAFQQSEFKPDNAHWAPRSVTVGDKVYYAHEVNYFYYGYVLGLAYQYDRRTSWSNRTGAPDMLGVSRMVRDMIKSCVLEGKKKGGVSC